MGRKKIDKLEEPIHLSLDASSLDRLLRFDAEARVLSGAIELEKLKREIVLAKLDPNGLLAKYDAKIRALTQDYQKSRETYERVQKTLGEGLGVDLTKYAIDDESGILRELSVDENKAS
jgi:hypothetical protein